MSRRALRLALAILLLLGVPAHGQGQKPAAAPILPQPPAASPLLPQIPAPVPGLPPSSAAPLPYAPNPPVTAVPEPRMPTIAGKPMLHLKALVTDEGKPIKSGLVWRIFQDGDQDSDGKMKLVATAAGGETSFQLEPGSYVVHAAYGRAGATTRVTMEKTERTETLVLNAGGVRLNAAVIGDLPVDPERVTFDIFSKDADQRGDKQALVLGAKPGKIIRLNADTYSVVSHYGDLNAVVRAEIHVNPGKLTEATVYHKAAKMTLKLVAEAGGEALAGVNWLVLNPSGDQIAETVGAFPAFVLAEGDYAVVAKHQGQVYNRNFSVEAGFDREVELLADGKPKN